MRRKERNGPAIINSDEAAAGPSEGEVAVASAGSEAAKLAKSRALADKRKEENSEATTKTEKQKGHFTAGFPLEPERSHATRSTSQRAGGLREADHLLFLGLGLPSPLLQIPMPAKITYIFRFSKQFRAPWPDFFSRHVSKRAGCSKWPLGFLSNTGIYLEKQELVG